RGSAAEAAEVMRAAANKTMKPGKVGFIVRWLLYGRSAAKRRVAFPVGRAKIHHHRARPAIRSRSAEWALFRVRWPHAAPLRGFDSSAPKIRLEETLALPALSPRRVSV